MIKAILMDFNGVIINDEPVQMRAYQEVLKEKGIELSEADYYASLGMDDRTFVEAAYGRVGKSIDGVNVDEIVTAKSSKWKSIVDAELPLFEGIHGFVEKMSREFTLGVVSMAGWNEIKFVLDKSGMAKFFSTIVSAADVSKCKPDPECFRIGFRQIDAVRTSRGHLPMTHDECLVIEDSPPGVLAARNADLPALGVANTVSASELRAVGARAVATDLRDWMPAAIRRVFV
jgi:beta-phosphoglucomutase-like phosphatase (HAD superfamily)